ncbi:MAG: ATP-binding protein [Spirosomataceae bacterium]
MIRFLLLFLVSFPLLGQKISIKNTIPQNLTPDMEVWVDPTAAKPFAETVREQFSVFHLDTYIATPSDQALWIKITLHHNVRGQKDWILECSDKGIEHIDFYLPDSTGHYSLIQRGMAVKKEYALSHNFTPYVPFRLEPGRTETIYLKIYGERSLLFQLLVLTPEAYDQKVINSSIQNSFLWGMLIIRMLYVFLLALVAVKEPLFRVYAFHLLFVTLSYFGVYNTLGRFFTDNLEAGVIINTLSSHFLGFTYLLFTLTALPLHQFHRSIKLILLLGMGFNLCVGFLIVADYNWLWLEISNDTVIFGWAFSGALFLYAFLKKIKVNWYYIIPFLLGNSYGSFQLVQVISAEWVAANVIVITKTMVLFFMAEFVFFGYFIGRIIRTYERSKLSSEKQLAFEKAQAERLTELDSLKNNFFANISHEFRTPLTLLVGPLADLQKKYPVEGLIPVMQRNLARLQMLINQLLDLSKLEAGKMEPQIRYDDLPHFLKYVFASFESLAQSKDILFQHAQSHTTFMAYFDEDKVEKIVTNLLSNAFKFTPANGRVTVEVTYGPHIVPSPSPSEAGNNGSPGGTWAVITVTDNGVGIDPQRLPRIFDRFYQADDSQRRYYEGTGIGLALVKELVHALKGTVDVESEPNKGAVFTVKLPCDRAHWGSRVTVDASAERTEKTVLASRTEVAVATQNPQNGESELPLLLIVEDNADLRLYVRNIFAAQYQIIEAADGQAGLEKAIEQIPDMVICDLMMPRLDGFGFCQALKSDLRTNHIPIVMLTAKATLKDRLEGLDIGADEYLSKPFNTEELLVRVRNLLKQRQLLQQKYNTLPAEVKAEDLPEKETVGEDRFLQKVNKVLQNHLADSRFDVEDFAGELNITAVQLRRKLKALTNQTVTEYVRHYRLEKAAELLKNKAGTVSEIAFRVGFESLPYFSKVFFETFGKSPSEWSKEGEMPKRS